MSDPFGEIIPPEFFANDYGKPGGLIIFLNNALRLLVAVAGIYGLLNFIIAGYQFMTASDDPKSLSSAWAKIWRTMVGLLIIAIAFVLAAILGYLLFGDATAILQPKIYGPK